MFATGTWGHLQETLYGMGAGLAYPTWFGLWSTHLDKKHESFEWGIYSTATGLMAAGTALIGAAIAQYVGFTYTFIFVGIMSLLGMFILFGLENHHKPKKINVLHYHKKRKLVHKEF